MEIILLGTGCPNVDPERMGPAQLVVHGGCTLLVDCGSGVTQRMHAAGVAGKELDAVLLTHLHSDHVMDLFQLITTSWQGGRERPLKVLGPTGTRGFVDGLMALWRPELDLRIAHERRASTAALEIEVTEIGEGEVFAQGELRVEAVAVDHRPVEPAYGFIFFGGGKKLAISGDTTYCPALIQAAQGANLLVHEVFSHADFQARPGVAAETVANVAAYHTGSDVVGKVAAEAGVGALMLSHFVPTNFDKGALLREVRREFKGLLILGEDLMRLELETGLLSYQRARVALDMRG